MSLGAAGTSDPHFAADPTSAPPPDTGRRAIVNGAAAAVLGGGAWALIVAVTNYEVGYVAWGVGGLVGYTMAKATTRRGRPMAMIAAALAAAGLLLGKAVIVQRVIMPQIDQEIGGDSLGAARAAAWELGDASAFPAPLQERIDALGPNDTLPDALWEEMVAAGATHLETLSPAGRRWPGRTSASSSSCAGSSRGGTCSGSGSPSPPRGACWRASRTRSRHRTRHPRPEPRYPRGHRVHDGLGVRGRTRGAREVRRNVRAGGKLGRAVPDGTGIPRHRAAPGPERPGALRDHRPLGLARRVHGVPRIAGGGVRIARRADGRPDESRAPRRRDGIPGRTVMTLILRMLLPLVLAGCATGGSGTGATSPAPRIAEEGLASWYGAAFHGRTTASGIPFDRHAMVAAHPSLPFGTRVRVHRLSTGATVEVEIVDRGPAAGPRRAGVVIDLSEAAARRLDFIEEGRTRVRLEVLPPGE